MGAPCCSLPLSAHVLAPQFRLQERNCVSGSVRIDRPYVRSVARRADCPALGQRLPVQKRDQRSFQAVALLRGDVYAC